MEHAGDHSAADFGFRGTTYHNYHVRDPKSFVTKVGGTFGLPPGPQLKDPYRYYSKHKGEVILVKLQHLCFEWHLEATWLAVFPTPTDAN